MSNQNIQISQMESVIMDALDKYKEEAEQVISDTLPLVGKETADELKRTSPRLSGEYANSWTYTMQQSRGSKNKNKLVVHNKKHYRIVHLLEKGHAKRNGGRVEAIVHVAPAQEHAEEKAIQRISDKLENLGV